MGLRERRELSKRAGVKKEFQARAEQSGDERKESAAVTLRFCVRFFSALSLALTNPLPLYPLCLWCRFGEVFKANYRGQEVAVKTLRNVDEDTVDRFREEILLMSDLKHSNVVNMIG